MERSRAATEVAAALFFLIFFPYAKCSIGAQVRQMGPRFAVEPASVVQYWSEAGARLSCVAHGDPPPIVTWLDHDGTPLDDRPTLRRVFSNGTLEIIPWSGSRTLPQTHSETLRCRAANAHGVVHSRDVTLEAVSEANWEVSLTAPAVAEGGVAALVCASPHSALVRPAVWYRGDRVLHADSSTLDARYLIADSALLIRDVSVADAGAYSCLARHSLTAHTKRSRPTLLAVIPGSRKSAPRLAPTPSELSVPSGSDLCMPCVASDHPTPHYTWYRESGGRLQPVEPSASVRLWAEGAAACLVRATRRATGSWLCKAYNAYGDATNQLRVQVRDTLAVTVTPPVVVADTGNAVRFKCTVNDPAASVSWLHDGRSAGASAEGGSGELIIRAVARVHRGMYQCFARRGRDTAQAAAELRLGDSGPELHYTFIEQALRPGGPVSLRCAASGSPAPTFTWLLDGQPLDHYLPPHRYSIHEETSPSGDAVSVLNISAATTAADGGRYTCRAQNARGHASHSARLNIYGAPSIRAPGPVRVVAGSNATVHCPYAGYPISSISWWWRGSERAAGVAGAVGVVGAGGRVSARGAELRLAPALATDAGLYACAVTAPDNTVAKRDIEIQVRNPPKISPFIFSTELTEGSSVQVLCGVSSGDKPMYFSWLKDGAPLPATLQIEEKSLNEFSLLMFSELTAQHSGEYTCRVSNHAATVNYTAPLSVKVAPAWTIEPSDSAVLLGAPLLLECAAKGYPVPIIKWYKRIGEGAASAQEGGEHWEEIGGGEWGSGAALKAHNDSLAASAASRHHQGVYRCKADNLVGPPLVKVINVTVHEPAHFDTSNGEERNVSCVRGRSASLTCSALGDMPLTIHWSHRGNRIDLNSYRSTVSEMRTADGLRSVLQLRAAERVDAGEYRCHARNQHGSSELIMYLRVEEPPETPRRVSLGGVSSRWVRLVWKIAPVQDVHFAALYTALHSLPGADTKHNTVNLTIESSGEERDGYQTFSARLDSLRPAVAYSLRLAAGNRVGRSPQSDPLIFTTLEEAPSGSPLNVHVRPASPGELHITWSAPVRDTWNGELLGYAVTWRELDRFDDAEEEARRSGTMTSPGWSSAEATLGGLRPFSRYAITVRAYNRAGAGPPSPTVFANTAHGVPEEAPTEVRCEPVSARSVRVRWASPRGPHAHALRGYDLHYAPLHYTHSWTGPAQSEIARAGPGGDATLQGLHTATNYSVFVRVRTDAGVGPPSSAVYCTTLEDVPGATESVRALAAGPDAVRVSWLAPSQRGGVLIHYTLYTRELGKVGGEWSQRVDVGSSRDGTVEGEEDEVFREVRGLRERTVYEFWVRAATAVGAGPPSRPVTAAPTYLVSARIASFGRVVRARRGARVRLRCAAVGAPPLRRRWVPLPNSHTVTDDGDLIIHNAEKQSAGNYTCNVRNGAGADSTSFALVVWLPPLAPALRLVRTDMYALQLAWDAPADGGSPLLGYSVWWSRESAGAEGGSGEPRSARVAPGDNAYSLSGLACGSLYRVTVRAHNAVGASSHSRPLLVRTRGDKAKAAPGKDFVWANSTTLRLNLLAWSGRCPVDAWTVALRLSAGGVWRDLVNNGETAEANDLKSGTWYEIRVVAHSPAGETVAQYKAATHTHNGERVGEPTELPAEPRPRAADGTVEVGSQWHTGVAPALAGGGLAALLAAMAAFALVRRRGATVCLNRDCSIPQLRRPHSQLYSTEPSKRNAKTLSPHDGDLHEISPYATFSMAGGGIAEESGPRGGSACALHLRTFGRAEHLDLGAPPNRPNLLRHSSEYGRAGGLRDSDSESSGSPCAACAAELYRLPAAHLSDTTPAVECSAEDTSSYSACGVPAIPAAGRSGAARRADRAPQRRRRDTSHSSGPTVRYKAAGPAVGGTTFGLREAL